MLEQIKGRVRFVKKQKKYLRKLRPWIGKNWELKDSEIVQMKKYIRILLERLQDNKCAYCGLPFKETSNSEIEHIAPKVSNPQFTFTPLNLALACHLCNGPIKKGRKQTITILHRNYRLCSFLIVHPYLDNPNAHFKWIPNGHKILISSRSAKGEESIKMFKLDNSAHSEARARLVYYEYNKIEDKQMEMILKKALEYKGTSPC
ncbi:MULTISPECIES: HNH endonuclease [Bacillus]|uniref:HNH endonuclease n=1 Tax=Bacillus TaxID=1386 RepID=UPI000B5DA702|nr:MULTISPECIES: HNH endonuclease [Bacillus]OXB96851.1 hypothetical protein CGQ22_22085 [Bacillus sp. M13(2017)]QCY64666.1 hypothetical protein FHE73_28605 [Bacillus thuringiensis]